MKLEKYVFIILQTDNKSIISTLAWKYAEHSCLFTRSGLVFSWTDDEFPAGKGTTESGWQVFIPPLPPLSQSLPFIYRPYVVRIYALASLLTCRRSWSSTPSFQHLKAALALSLSKFFFLPAFFLFLPLSHSSHICIFTYEMCGGRWDLLSTLWLHEYFNVCSTHNISLSTSCDSLICSAVLEILNPWPISAAS
jgi:hypothetical protein